SAPEGFDGLIMWAARLSGPKAVPGTYKARLTANGTTSETEFTILKDPRTEGSVADIQAQFDFIQGVNAKMTETHQTIKDIRSARVQMNDLKDRLGKEDAYKELVESINEINKKMTAVEEELYQTKNRSGQDPLNYPIRLNNKLGHLSSVANSSDYKPTDQTIAVKTEIESAINEQLTKWEQIKNSDIPQLNEKAKQKGVEAVMLKKGDASSM
ncbi:MAG: glycosyl hydrolase, partial [Imperialibacter sp.]